MLAQHGGMRAAHVGKRADLFPGAPQPGGDCEPLASAWRRKLGKAGCPIRKKLRKINDLAPATRYARIFGQYGLRGSVSTQRNAEPRRGLSGVPPPRGASGSDGELTKVVLELPGSLRGATSGPCAARAGPYRLYGFVRFGHDHIGLASAFQLPALASGFRPAGWLPVSASQLFAVFLLVRFPIFFFFKSLSRKRSHTRPKPASVWPGPRTGKPRTYIL